MSLTDFVKRNEKASLAHSFTLLCVWVMRAHCGYSNFEQAAVRTLAISHIVWCFLLKFLHVIIAQSLTHIHTHTVTKAHIQYRQKRAESLLRENPLYASELNYVVPIQLDQEVTAYSWCKYVNLCNFYFPFSNFSLRYILLARES